MSILVIDIGTSGVRAAVFDAQSAVVSEQHAEFLPSSPTAGLVEFDANALIDLVIDLATAVIATVGSVDAVGITNQRATTVVWDRATGVAIGPAIGWQDIRTVGTCLELQGEGIFVAPNATATKAAWLLDTFDADRQVDARIGTIDSWVIWHLTEGTHVTDRSNASATGLVNPEGASWSASMCDRLRIDIGTLPRLVDSAGPIAPATRLPGAPMVAGLAGDQQASLLGQGCVTAGDAKVTFGTGGMLDVCVGTTQPGAPAAGTFPMVAWHMAGTTTWLTEGVMLAAGTSIVWLRDELGIIDDVADIDAMASSVESSDGVVFIPAMQGLGTPVWDHGARGGLLGLHRGTTNAHICRAVLEGIASRGADLVEAAQTDAGCAIASLRVDGGMTASPAFVQALANATALPIEVSPHREATAVGAAHLAGIGTGVWTDERETAALWKPASVVLPTADVDRERWLNPRARAEKWIPELSGLTF